MAVLSHLSYDGLAPGLKAREGIPRWLKAGPCEYISEILSEGTMKLAESEGACQSFSKTSEIDGTRQENKTGSQGRGWMKVHVCVRVC